MAARVNSRRWAVGALAVVLALASDAPATAAEPVMPAELRARAEAAEQAGDWEAAFTLYCQLYVADRSATPDLRDRLAGAFRRVQQLRRHRDPAYQSFAASLQPGDALTLYAELVTRLGQVYADPARSAPQVLWSHGVEEFDRALGNPVFVAAFLDDPSPARIESFRLALRTDWVRRPVRTAKEARATLRLLMNEAQDRCPLRLASAVVVEFLCGSCTGLDEYTVYLNPAMTTPDLAAADLSEYGVYLTSRDDQLVVAGVAAGSWAAHNTNLRKGDRVTRINGRPIEVGCVAAAAEALRMPLGGFHEVETAPPAPDMLPGVARLPVTLPTVY
ncbi:MAG: PDZ domain-containing protein, partial [Gemmataceae bacterium]|nr:PDZ domain-containing protein [Gemmataceae bacterium]